MKIIEMPEHSGDWLTAVVCGRWVQAKIFNEPSTFGINNGRISKLVVGKTDVCRKGENFLNQMCFSYDRGLDFDEAPDGLIDSIVAELEQFKQLPCDDA